MLNTIVRNRRSFSLIAMALALALGTVASAFARSCTGGDCSGGGSGVADRFFDALARENTLQLTNEVHARLRPVLRAFEQLQDVGENSINGYGLSQFLFSTSRQRFVVVDKLPEAINGDVKHDMADRLVALQRGPMVWVEKKFAENASAEDLATFLIHEYLVGEKLKTGPLSRTDMDQVVHATAAIMETFPAHSSVSISNEDVVLQRILNRNGFREGLNRQQFIGHMRLFSRFYEVIEGLCKDALSEADGLRQIGRFSRVIRSRATDQTLPLAAREEYQKIDREISEKVGAVPTKAKICELYEDGLLDNELSGDDSKKSAREISEEVEQTIRNLNSGSEPATSVPMGAQ
jgi:hypothetical protein